MNSAQGYTEAWNLQFYQRPWLSVSDGRWSRSSRRNQARFSTMIEWLSRFYDLTRDKTQVAVKRGLFERTNSRSGCKKNKTKWLEPVKSSRYRQSKNKPSSKISNLLFLTIALARAKIWRWPTDKLLPPLEISLSSVRRASSDSVWRENSPAARSALLSVPSSCWSNGSRFLRRVPLRSSG